MAGVTYILDTNVISDLLKGHPNVQARLRDAMQQEAAIILCQPVLYEVRRGLLWVGATSKQAVLERDFLPLFQVTPLLDGDWALAARFWADAVSTGRQLADIDLLVAAIAARLGAIIVSSDADFDALPVPRHDWRRDLSRSPAV
jgi:tRNA(fMet)-specific endonuclease VapC